MATQCTAIRGTYFMTNEQDNQSERPNINRGFTVT